MTKENKSTSLVVRVGEQYGVDPTKLLTTLKKTAFSQAGDKEVTDEQMMALLVVAERYDLNPFVNQLYAFPSKGGGIVPVVGVDGWSHVINRDPDFAGIEFRQSDEIVEMPGAKPCPEWIEAVIHHKNRDVPTTVREYLDEVYRPPIVKNDVPINGPWQTHTKRMLRHKALIQAGRVAFGLSGIYDEDEAQRVLEGKNQAIEAEIVDMDIEDAEEKLKALLVEGGLTDLDSYDLPGYIREVGETTGLSGEQIIKNYVVGFTADKGELVKFIGAFRAWQGKRQPQADDPKKKLIAEIDEMISVIKDGEKAEAVVEGKGLELGNLEAGSVEDLGVIKKELGGLVDKQTEMF